MKIINNYQLTIINYGEDNYDEISCGTIMYNGNGGMLHA